MSDQDHGLTPPGPPAPDQPSNQPFNQPFNQPNSNPYGQPAAPAYGAPLHPAPPPQRRDAGLGWTAFGLAFVLCVPLLPLVGAVLAILTLARRRFRPRWVAVLALVVGLLATELQAAAVPSFIDGVQEGLKDSVDDEAEDARRSGDSGEVSTLALKLGDCFDSAQLKGAGTETVITETVILVPCARKHDLEIFASYTLRGDDFPGQAAIDREGAKCVAAFQKFVGVAYDDSVFEFIYTFPTKRSWRILDDREVQCAIGHPKQKVTGSLRNRRR